MAYDWLVPRLILPLYERLSGRRPWTEALRLRELQWRSPTELEARALQKLRPLLAHAATHVPHYRDLFRQAGLAPGDIRAVADLSALPVTGKAELRANFPGRVTAGNLPARRRREQSTAGSTGLPLEFYADRAASDAWLGSYLLFREWAGAPLGHATVYIPRPACISPRDVRLTALINLTKRALFGERTLYLADFAPDAEELYTCLRRFPRGCPYVVWGFPSYISRIAAQILEAGDRLLAYPEVVIAYAETLSPLDASIIARAFRCRVVNHYSSWEVRHIAQTCPDNPDVLHVNSERALLRVIRPDGRPAAPGETGRVVITDLANYVMPFINYDIGDWAAAGGPCSCGRGFPTLLGIEGRLGEVVHTPDGRIVFPIAVSRFLNVVAHAHPYLWEYQTVQTAIDHVVFAVVPTSRFTPRFARKLETDLEAFLGPGMHVRVETVDRIAPEPSGKRLLVKSNLPFPSATPSVSPGA